MTYPKLLFILPLLLLVIHPDATAGDKKFQLETIINTYTGIYAFDDDNRFKLAAYAEIKGQYRSEHQAFILDFGNLGNLTFFDQHCLLKTKDGHVYTLARTAKEWNRDALQFNLALHKLFEKIPLLSNHDADREHIHFVNTWLAKKNMEPFDKVYTRFILIKYGQYYPDAKRVRFHTDWLPANTETLHSPILEAQLVKGAKTRMIMQLDETSLRGLYIESGGEVFVNDVKRNVHYATGEEYEYNVSAYKLFIQQLFVLTAQFVSKKPSTPANPSGYLYNPNNWIPMMIGVLRENNTITHPEVLRYLVDQPFFPKFYEQLSPKEKKIADKFR